MTETGTPARHATPYALHGERVVYFRGYLTGDTAALYDPATLRQYSAPVAEITRPQGGQRVQLTPAQATVARYRFEDVATDAEDFGAVLEGDTLRITDPAEALATLDAAAELCDAAAEDGIAGRRREAIVTRNLRAKVYAAVTAE